MTRLTIVTGVAVLALALPAPTTTHPSETDPPAVRLPLPTRDPLGLTEIGRETSGGPVGPGRRASRDPNRPRVIPRVSLDPDDGTHRARLDEAVERFDSAGLLLPDLQVGFSDSDEACQGHLGLFDRSSTPWRVSVCSDLTFVLTHELAHAWAAANLDDAQRAAYTEYRGLLAWSDSDLTWRERGTEDAAFVLHRVLMAKAIPTNSTVWVERIAAFEQLTGRPPPRLDAASVSDRPEATQEFARPGRAS